MQRHIFIPEFHIYRIFQSLLSHCYSFHQRATLCAKVSNTTSSPAFFPLMINMVVIFLLRSTQALAE